MYLSQIVEIGTVDEVFGDPQHPYTERSLAAILLPDPAPARRHLDALERLVGEIPSPIDLPARLLPRRPLPLRHRTAAARSRRPWSRISTRRPVRCWRARAGELDTDGLAAPIP